VIVLESTATAAAVESTSTSVLIEAVEVWTEYGWLSAAQPIVVENHEVRGA